MNSDFASEWAAVVTQVAALVRSLMRNSFEVDDVVQEVCARAYRGYDTFQRQSSFKTWVITIARREVIRHGIKKEHTETLENAQEPVQSPPTPTPDAAGRMREAVRSAVEAGVLDRQQGDVVIARLETDGLDWGETAARLGLNANHCAVLHFRGVTDLRVYLFVAKPELLGGRLSIEEAFAAARSARVNPLTAAETAAFRQAVLEKTVGATVRGVLGPLRSACTKVALRLEDR